MKKIKRLIIFTFPFFLCSVISGALRLQHLHISNCLSNYIFQVMLSSSEFSDRIDTEPEIMNALASHDLDSKLYLLNSIQGSAVIAYSLQKIA